MKERPILFSAPMVRAILEGRKTQTRRVVKPQPIACDKYVGGAFIERRPGRTDGGQDRTAVGAPSDYVARVCPYGRIGDRLWVRETFAHWTARDIFSGAPVPVTAYRAGRQWRNGNCPSYEKDKLFWKNPDDKPTNVKWKSPIHMPRWASRITLEITDVRVQRVQDISEADAIAEGCDAACGMSGDDDLMVSQVQQMRGFDSSYSVARFVLLWDSINGKRPGVTNWNVNPCVWALTFKRVEQPA